MSDETSNWFPLSKKSIFIEDERKLEEREIAWSKEKCGWYLFLCFVSNERVTLSWPVTTVCNRKSQQLTTYRYTPNTPAIGTHTLTHTNTLANLQRIAYHCSLSAPILLCYSLTHIQQIAEFMDLIFPPSLDCGRFLCVFLLEYICVYMLTLCSVYHIYRFAFQKCKEFIGFLFLFPKGKLNIEHTASFFQQ